MMLIWIGVDWYKCLAVRVSSVSWTLLRDDVVTGSFLKPSILEILCVPFELEEGHTVML